MSETEINIGKLTPTGESGDIENAAKIFLQAKGDELDKECYDSYLEQLENDYYKEIVVLDGKIYTVEMKNYEYENIYKAKLNADGTIDFIVKYYNGGCYLQEAIEKALEKCNA